MIATDMTDPTSLEEWIRKERAALWNDFRYAVDSAMRTPDPDDPEYERRWSMDMLDKVDRIREADQLLGDKIGWKQLPWRAFAFYRTIEGEDLPDEAWSGFVNITTSNRR